MFYVLFCVYVMLTHSTYSNFFVCKTLPSIRLSFFLDSPPVQWIDNINKPLLVIVSHFILFNLYYSLFAFITFFLGNCSSSYRFYNLLLCMLLSTVLSWREIAVVVSQHDEKNGNIKI
jgi:hypothetical protein